ncbi:SCO3374 family protein [Streptomyces cadmiisoli]|uniref:SCO3374 family protein n=1 Tax=Streptomyces cadmiisoli TaxID=2184053 RepID=UPI003D7026B3
MVGSAPPAPPAHTVPPPRRPPDPSGQVRRWYEDGLGWATVPGSPLRLAVGLRFDVLDVPEEAGRAALRHLRQDSPVALQDGRMRFLVAADSARELPGLLSWLEWGSLALDLTAVGEGGVIDAPLPPAGPARRDPAPGAPRSGTAGPEPLQGAAMWLRPPEPGCEVEASLPTLSALGGGGSAPDLVRLVETVATHCHRIRLRRASAQPLAFS